MKLFNFSKTPAESWSSEMKKKVLDCFMGDKADPNSGKDGILIVDNTTTFYAIPKWDDVEYINFTKYNYFPSEKEESEFIYSDPNGDYYSFFQDIVDDILKKIDAVYLQNIKEGEDKIAFIDCTPVLMFLLVPELQKMGINCVVKMDSTVKILPEVKLK